jgi:ankyrin repeat protein
VASRYGHVDVVRVLLGDPRVDPSAQSNDALRQACRWGHAAVVHLLLLHTPRVNVNQVPQPPPPPVSFINELLRVALRRGHVDVVRELLMQPGVRGQYSRVERWMLVNTARVRSWTT